MKFTVSWRQPAETALLAALLRANDKPGYWAAVRDIDRRLATDPHAEGESREEGIRTAFLRPFEIVYSIDTDARTVVIERLRWVGA